MKEDRQKAGVITKTRFFFIVSSESLFFFYSHKQTMALFFLLQSCLVMMKRNTLTGQFILSACMFNLTMSSFISALSVKQPLCRSHKKVLEGTTLPIASLAFIISVKNV